jgi:hypothetical protein
MDESAHEDIAEFGISCDERTQGIRGHLKELSRLANPSARHRAGSGDQDHVSGEVSQGHGSQILCSPESFVRTISSFPESTTKQGIPKSPASNSISPVPNCSHSAIRPDAVDLGRGQNREGLSLPVRCVYRWLR